MPNNDNLPKLLRPADIRKYLHIGNNALYKMLERDDFPSIRFGNSWYIIEDEFCKWMVSQAYTKQVQEQE